MTARLGSDLHRLGAGFTVRFTASGARLAVEWTPRLPTRREFRRLQARYRSARDAFVGELAVREGGVALLLEL